MDSSLEIAPTSALTPLSTMLFVALFLVIASQLLVCTVANHFACIQAPSSKLNGKVKWCDAANNGQDQYICNSPPEAARQGPHQVADYNRLGGVGKRLLEFGTPCGRGGYGTIDPKRGMGKAGWYCPENWIVEANGQPYYLKGKDDCEDHCLFGCCEQLKLTVLPYVCAWVCRLSWISGSCSLWGDHLLRSQSLRSSRVALDGDSRLRKFPSFFSSSGHRNHTRASDKPSICQK